MTALLPRICLSVLLLSAGRPLLFAAQAPAPEEHASIDYSLVVTGGELLSGAYPDGHTYFLTRTLRPVGYRCRRSITVDDHPEDIESAVRSASQGVKLLIVTGGLGPTGNDVTRETLAACTGISLEEHPSVLQEMERRFGTHRDQLRSNLRRQARVPARGTYLKNSNGTAVGLVFELDKTVVVALPGPPRELEPMVRDELIPYLNQRFGTRLPGCSLTVRFVGTGQSAIDQSLREHVTLPANVILNSSFQGGRVDFTFALPHDTLEDRARLESVKQQLVQRLGDYIYALDDTSLEQVVVRRLTQQGLTLALAEVGSSAGLAASIEGEPGVENVLLGAYTAPTEQRLRQLLHVSDEAWAKCESADDRAKLIAAAVADETRSAWVLAVGEPSLDGQGNRSLTVLFRLPDGRQESQRFAVPGTGESARKNLVTQSLDQLRRRLR